MTALQTAILIAMVACFAILPASIIAYRCSTESPETPHDPADCPRCTAMRHPSQRKARAVLERFPRQGGGAR